MSSTILTPEWVARIESGVRAALAVLLAFVALAAAPDAREALRRAHDQTVQSADVAELERGAPRTSETLVLQGRLLRAGAVRQRVLIQHSRWDQLHNEVSYYVPLVSEGWTPSTPIQVIVESLPSQLNLTASAQGLADAPSYQGAVRSISDEVRQELLLSGRLRLAERAFVLKMGARPSTGDEAFLLLVVGHAALLALWFALTAIHRARPVRPQLHALLRQIGQKQARGGHFLAHCCALPVLLIWIDGPEVLGWIGIAVLGPLGVISLTVMVRDLLRPAKPGSALTNTCAQLGLPLDAFASRLDEELGSTSLRMGTLAALPSWLCSVSNEGDLAVVPYEDIYWFYADHAGPQRSLRVEYITPHRDDQTALPREVQAIESATRAEALMSEIGRRAPHAAVGWSPDAVTRRVELSTARELARRGGGSFRGAQ